MLKAALFHVNHSIINQSSHATTSGGQLQLKAPLVVASYR